MNRFLAPLGILLLPAMILGCVTIDVPVDLESYIADRMELAGIPGMAVGIMTDGELTYNGSFGFADIQAERSVDENTVFMIASVSKTVTSSALMLLESRGHLRLDDSIGDYMPFQIEHPWYPDIPITFRMLLSHTSGIEDNWAIYDSFYTIDSGGGDSPVTLEDLVTGYFVPGGSYYDKKKNFSHHTPGSKHSYSNMGYALIGYLVQEISGTDFSQFCTKEIFGPLEMNSTSWRFAELDPTNLAMPYKVADDEIVPIGHYGFSSYPDGQLRTTVSDYSRFLKSILMPGDFLPTGTVEEILRIQFPVVHQWQAVAWNYNEFDSAIVNHHIPHLPAHTGGDPGVATIVVMDPENKSAVIVFANGYRTDFRAIKNVYLDILKRLCFEAGML